MLYTALAVQGKCIERLFQDLSGQVIVLYSAVGYESSLLTLLLEH